MSREITRRTFLSAAAGVGAGLGCAAGLAGLSNPGLAPMIAKASENGLPAKWDYEYDIVVCGAGAAGLLAALKAAQQGCKVLCIDANYDTGGHAAVSHGLTHSGGGTKLQKSSGVEDTADQYYLDHTDPAFLNTRFNDRALLRTVANNMAECFDWMLDNGLKFPDGTTVTSGLGDEADSVARTAMADSSDWVKYDTGSKDSGNNGVGVTRPFEQAAREAGVDFMMERHMDSLVVDGSGRVVGLYASHNPRTLSDGTRLTALNADKNITDETGKLAFSATKAVIIATGGGMGNEAYRTMFDPRWTSEYDGVAGEPFSFQDASGEMAGLAIGAGLGCTANWTSQCAMSVTVNRRLGTRYGYQNLSWLPESDLFELAGATGILLSDPEGLIQVNMLGERFYNEDIAVYGSEEETYDYFAACMGSVILEDSDGTGVRRVGGPIWSIFDSQTVDYNVWKVEYPGVNTKDGYFFKADTLEELAKTIVNKYFEDVHMDPDKLVAAVKSYNDAVDKGKGDPFGRSSEHMTQKIEKGPFYAAWSTPILHDSLTGLRIGEHCNVLRVDGTTIEGLYACGECAGGHHVHGLGKAQTAGYVAGKFASQ